MDAALGGTKTSHWGRSGRWSIGPNRLNWQINPKPDIDLTFLVLDRLLDKCAHWEFRRCSQSRSRIGSHFHPTDSHPHTNIPQRRHQHGTQIRVSLNTQPGVVKYYAGSWVAPQRSFSFFAKLENRKIRRNLLPEERSQKKENRKIRRHWNPK